MLNFRVAANTPFNASVLTYKSIDGYEKGQCVEVPLGTRSVLAWILEVEKDAGVEGIALKEIQKRGHEVLDLTAHELSLFQWMAEYYHYPLGQLIADTLPKAMKKPRPEAPLELAPLQELPALTTLQLEIYAKLKETLRKGFSRHLLHGVTGSGKTHIYLQLIQETIAAGKSVLFLLPEINLTPQFLEKFRAHLNCDIHVYSSEVTASAKFNLRDSLKKDLSKARVVIGVRSSVFLPMENAGLIIVDEEHDSSFKQEDRCTYNARDVAIKRASMLKIPVILGSATPSLETYKSTVGGESYHKLTMRVHQSTLPMIKLVDQREATTSGPQEHWPLASQTIEALYQAKKNGEQALVFINRLGFSNYVQCSSCGHQFHCLNCSTNLRYFKARAELSCQTCGIKMPMPKICPECSCLTLVQKGYGTEKVEEVLKQVIPELRVERFDRDEIKTMDQLRASLDRFHNHEVDVLVGTQMLSKGHNFKRVNTVIVLGIDQQLNFPDFRALERAWQTLVQVSGRSGRFGQESRVLVQTYTPEHPLFYHVVNHHFDEFYADELELRERAECPPISKLAALYMTHKDKGALVRLAVELGHWLQGLQEHHFPEVAVLGPRPALMEKRVNKFTWCLMLRSNNINSLHTMINAVKTHLANQRGLALKIDVDPQVIL